ncbi:MAG: hypothetical protein ABSH44_00645 [Bryobacteraceae bacterium]|jgi:hypothetical protein
MDDFRVGSISPYDPDHRQELPGPVKRKRDKRTEEQALEEDEAVMASEESEAGEEPIQDYYEPSGGTEEPE